MAAILKKYQLGWTDASDGTVYNFFFLAPPDHYTGIEAETGVIALPDDSSLLDMPVTKTAEMAISPVCARKSIRYRVGVTVKYADILISATLANNAQDTLVGRQYKGGTIERVLDPRKASRY